MAFSESPSKAKACIDPPSLNDESVDISPLSRHVPSRRAASTLAKVQRVSKRAALASKKVIWDSNDASIDAAQSAVDQWESAYNALRGLLVASAHSARGLYGAAKAGANGLEHGFLLPVRDWILMPAFVGVERLAGEASHFLQSDQAAQVADASLVVVRNIPWVGEDFLAPALCRSVDVVQTAWQIAQYPIPSKQQVRESVDFALTGTKWALSTAGREVLFYVQRADANITRTLSHTQWKVLGSGPYATLDKLSQQEVIDHLCERYFSLESPIQRYELAVHIRCYNRPLYQDLVLTGLLRERGGENTQDDEWLSPCPSYRDLETPFLLQMEAGQKDAREPVALWFRLAYQNGKRPGREVPWTRFPGHDRVALEERFTSMMNNTRKEGKPFSVAYDAEEEEENANNDVGFAAFETASSSSRYPTVASWYIPDPSTDIYVDQKRHAVSFFPCCPRCRRRYPETKPPLSLPDFGELCLECQSNQKEAPWVEALQSPPPLAMVMRPTMWRFHGPGDEIRRAVWFLDTQRHGLQPYGEEAQAVLEDAFLFLKWSSRQQVRTDGMDAALLTVQVQSPDGGEQQLVQFSSLMQATAIQKGLAGAIALFKRRVYRGACIPSQPPGQALDDHIREASASSEKVAVEMEDALQLDPQPDVTNAPAYDNVDGVISEASRARTTKEAAEAEPAPPATGETSLTNEAAAVQASLCPQDAIETTEGECKADLDVLSDDDTLLDSSSKLTRAKVGLSPLGECASDVALTVPPSRLSATDIPCCSSGIENQKIDHLVLIVHGIGEMLRSIDLFGLMVPALSSITECCACLRKNHSEVQAAHSSHIFPSKHSSSRGRVEYLPIEWHETFALLSQRQPTSDDVTNEQALAKLPRGITMKDISLRTIPQMRTFANDTLMDVLYFMSPEHHDILIDIVTNEMIVVVEKFRSITGFDGEISVIGHSLGSIITWDILAHQIPSPDEAYSYMSEPTAPAGISRNSRTPKVEEEKPQPSTPEARRGRYPKLPFTVTNTFLLGSPVAVFLMIRNQRKPLCADFCLSGCERVFNVFHPYDPVAYRIEPLIDARNADFEPKIITHWNGGFRVQYQTKRIWKKLMDETWKTQQNVIDAFEASMAGLGLLDSAADDLSDGEGESESTEDNPMNHVVAGKLNAGRRIDYMLQEKEIEHANEYVAAFAAHSSYWDQKDLSLFIARQIILSSIEHATEAADKEFVDIETPTPSFENAA